MWTLIVRRGPWPLIQYVVMCIAAATLTVLDAPPLVQWIVWGLLFFAYEIPGMAKALKDGDGTGNGTLSHYVWRFMGVGPFKGTMTKGVQLRRIFFMAFWAWITAHFFFQFA
jgi:hypothetical protein